MTESLPSDLFAPIAEFLAERECEFDQITEERKALLGTLADYIRDSLQRSGRVKLTFICTHNSRRSHLSQIWAKVAADARGLRTVETFSGGTEATAMNPRVVTALRGQGFEIRADDDEADNPVYSVRYSADAEPIRCFSKVYDAPPNPTEGYAAVMTCSSADDACPIVPGCDLRSPIRYEDPKVADDTPKEARTYAARSKQICREMLFAMRQV